ncbi:hypothetical protein BDW59DRAFT_156296 [Aspergillus cavernicola]|uniref:Peptidase A2 domain-containing protein n=1 Tax=Aspergillus cavernicola TaxID=176166 RepID=A0ABR4J2T7_9EURO
MEQIANLSPMVVNLHNFLQELDMLINVGTVGVVSTKDTNAIEKKIPSMMQSLLRSYQDMMTKAITEESHQISKVLHKSHGATDMSFKSKRYFIDGIVKGTPVEALPDYGADTSFISDQFANSLGLSLAPATHRTIRLANGKEVESPGMVEVPWKFAGERKSQPVPCWILPGSIHNLVLGSPFLKTTKTLTRFASRIKSKLIIHPRRLRLQLLGEESSDVMLVSRAYANQIGMKIDDDPNKSLEVEFADGTTAWTSGVVHDALWSVGDSTVRCDFYVLDDLCVDVVLNNHYLFDFNVFSEFEEYFIDADSEDSLRRLCNIRLIGKYGGSLGRLEEDYQQDLNSPDAFGHEKTQRELARRDKIRDEIQALPEDQQTAARLDESERQRR